jgi:hypothetical protein
MAEVLCIRNRSFKISIKVKSIKKSISNKRLKLYRTY